MMILVLYTVMITPVAYAIEKKIALPLVEKYL